MVLKRFPSGNNSFMKCFSKFGMKKMSLNTKLSRNYLNQLKSLPRNYTFRTSSLNFANFMENCNSTQAEKTIWISKRTIIQLIDQIANSFEKYYFILVIFMDLSKAFDIVYHSILIKKLYGVQGSNLRWFESYFSNRKEYISYNNKNCTTFESITCGVSHGYILGPLLFLIHVRDPPNATNILDPVMFANDTNLLYSHHDIKTLFYTVNEELEKLGGWFTANKYH